MLNDMSPKPLMRQFEMRQKVCIKKVAKRTVSDIVQEAGKPNGRFNESATGNALACRGAHFRKAEVESIDRSTAQMHRSQNMLEASVLGRGVNPPCRLQLVDVTHPLHPGMVNDLPFGHLIVLKFRARRKWNVAVDWVVAEIIGGNLHGAIIEMLS